jgi:hypothetical protein
MEMKITAKINNTLELECEKDPNDPYSETAIIMHNTNECFMHPGELRDFADMLKQFADMIESA